MAQTKKTILIVEDDPALRTPLSEQLTGEGFNVLQAGDGEAGLASALEHHPDLILLDIIMPKMNGLVLLEKLRQDPWGKNVQVMMLTNFSDPGNIAQAVQSEVFEYIIKSNSSLDEITAKIKAKLN